MFSYKRHGKYLIVAFLTISLGINLFLTTRLKTLREKVTSSNTITSLKLESAIRDTMHSIKELNKTDNTDNKETINNLQLSVRQLLLIFNNWVDLRRPESNPKESLQKGLSALETLRNTIVYHLGNQYNNNSNQLTNYDTVLLDKVYEKLDRLLIVYNNIEKTKNINGKNDNGLGQWAENIEEICRLYRHSRIPNEHPDYINEDIALTNADGTFPMLGSFKGSKKIRDSVQIRDGVHYYEIGYYNKDDLRYLVWIDAIDGSLRLFEDYTENYDDRIVSRSEALKIAKSFMNELVPYDEVIDGISAITDESSRNMIYAFKFTPVLRDIAIVSDCVNINVSSKGGNIIKYSNSFSDTEIPDMEPDITLDDIGEIYKEQLINAKYNGLAVVRSFNTNYKPVITYSYKSMEKENITRLYIDVATGNQVHESYSVYESIPHIATEEHN